MNIQHPRSRARAEGVPTSPRARRPHAAAGSWARLPWLPKTLGGAMEPARKPALCRPGVRGHKRGRRCCPGGDRTQRQRRRSSEPLGASMGGLEMTTGRRRGQNAVPSYHRLESQLHGAAPRAAQPDGSPSSLAQVNPAKHLWRHPLPRRTPGEPRFPLALVNGRVEGYFRRFDCLY